MPRIRFCLAVIVLLSAAVPARAAAPSVAGRPNVVFLLTDDQQASTIAALGHLKVQTPHFDKLVRDGLTFRNAYCMGGYSSAVCLPSREMIQSGRAWFSSRNLPREAPCLAKTLNEAGYYTFHLGKRGNTPLALQAHYTHNEYLNDDADRTSGYPMKTLADKVVDFLRQYPQNAGGKPFFMYLAPPNPHDPRVAAPEYLSRYDVRTIALPANFLPFHPFDNGDLFVRDERLAPWPRTPDEIRRQLRDYYAVVTAMDEQWGRIVDALKSSGQYDNTILIYSSDQGIALGSHGLMGKQNLYEPSVNSQLVLAGPGIPKGRSVDSLAYLFDIYPTICGLVGTAVPASLEGKSLLPVIQGRVPAVRDTIFLAYRDIQRGVRQGRWKLLRYPRVDKTQLFDLQADPDETKDVAADPASAQTVRRLLEVMKQQQNLFGDTQPLVVATPQPAAVDIELFKHPPPLPKPKPKKKSK